LRQGDQQSGDLHLAQDRVSLGVLQDLLQIGAAALELLAKFGACLTCLSSLLQGLCTLLRGQLGKCHGIPPYVIVVENLVECLAFSPISVGLLACTPLLRALLA